MMGDYENVLLVKPKVFVYRIPPLGTGGHKAADWNLDNPSWVGRMRLVSIGKRLEMRLEDGETCDLYAKCPIEAHPGNAIEAVSDSSRYFVIRLQNDNGQKAFVGCGFQERNDAFDFNVALQDHFRYIERSAALEKQDLSSAPSLDLAFKEGQTISINIGKKDKNIVSRPRPTPVAGGGIVPLLPPPPGAGDGTNAFLKGGTKMFKWDPCGLVCVALIYFLIAYADYVILIWLLLPTFGHSIWTVFHGIIFNLLLITTLIAHTRAMLSDPGVVPISASKQQKPGRQLNYSSDEEDESDEEAAFRRDNFNRPSATEWTMCTRCDSLRPPRAHHCRVCKRCIRKMDHHCPWVNNCVGEYNQKWFLQFILYVGASSLYSLLILCLCWVWHDAYGPTGIKGPLGENIYHAKVIHSIMLAMESALFGLFVLAVSCDQLGAIFTDETAVEACQRRGRNYLASSRRPRNSKVAMMKQVCGSGPKLLWLVPCVAQHKSSTRYIRTHNQLAHFEV